MPRKKVKKVLLREGPTERKRRQRAKEKEEKERAAEELKLLEIREYIRENNISIQNPNRMADMEAIKRKHEALLQAGRERNQANVDLHICGDKEDQIDSANQPKKKQRRVYERGPAQLIAEPVQLVSPIVELECGDMADDEQVEAESLDSMEENNHHQSMGLVYETQELFNGEKLIYDKIKQKSAVIDPTLNPPKLNEVVNVRDSDFESNDDVLSGDGDGADTDREMKKALRNPHLMREGIIAFIDESDDESSAPVSDTDVIDELEAKDRNVLPIMEDGLDFEENYDPNEPEDNNRDSSDNDSDDNNQSESLIAGSSRAKSNVNNKASLSHIIGAITERPQNEDDDEPPPDFQISAPAKAYNFRRMTRCDYHDLFETMDVFTNQTDRNNALYKHFMTFVNVFAFKEVQATAVWNLLSAAMKEHSLLTYPTIRKHFERMLPAINMIYEFYDNVEKDTFAHAGEHYPRSEFPRPRFTLMCEWTFVTLSELYRFFLEVHHESPNSAEGKRKEMDLFVDGVPLTQSGDALMNVCTIRFNDCEMVWPLAIQIYRQGHVTEMLRLIEKIIDDSIINGFTIRRFIGDSPMRSKLKCVAGHAGYYCCERCYYVGKYDKAKRKMTFPHSSTLYKARTMEEWVQIAEKIRDDPTSVPTSKRFGITGYSPLLKLGYFDLINDFPVDPMHNVALGCGRRILHNILAPKKKSKVITDAGAIIADKFDDIWINIDLPSEFIRRPRPMKANFVHYKAVEFMAIIVCGFHALYLALEGETFRSVRKMWIYFIWIVRMALLPCRLFKQRMTIAKAYEIQKTFYEQYQKCFGADQCVFNIHSFSHLFTVKYIGLLSLFSALPFESYFSFLKRIIVPNTLSFSKQVMTKSFIANLQDHNCKSRVKLTIEPGPKRHCNNLIATMDGRYFCLKKSTEDGYYGTHIPTKRFFYPEAPELDLSEVFIRQLDHLSETSDDIFISTDEIMSKAIIYEDLIIAVPNETYKV